MRELVFLLEEESAKALLEQLMPRLMPIQNMVRSRFIVFEGKQDLEKQLVSKLRGYLNPQAHFIVLQDQDQTDCHTTKKRLKTLCAKAGRSRAKVRIACRELEAFYLGDLRAVELGLGISGIANKQEKAKFRDPDQLDYPARELEKLTRERYQKVAGSRAIAPHLNVETKRSASFRHLIQAIRKASLDGHQD